MKLLQSNYQLISSFQKLTIFLGPIMKIGSALMKNFFALSDKKALIILELTTTSPEAHERTHKTTLIL